VGSSANNSELNLLLGYNGVSRLMGRSFGMSAVGGPFGNPPAAPGGFSGSGPDGRPGDSAQGSRRDGQNLFQGGFPGGGPGFGDTGTPGWLRFFSQPLGKEMSWLLPMALGLLALTLFSAKPRLPVLDAGQRSFLLWGGWLLTGLVFFSLAGFFHSYYLALLTPALGGVIGAGSVEWGRAFKRWPWLAACGLLLLAGGTLWFQGWLAGQLGVESPVLAWPWFTLAAGAALLAVYAVAHQASGSATLPWGLRGRLLGGFCTAVGLAVLIIPFYWSVWTVEAPLTGLPGAFSGRASFRGGGGFGPDGGRGDANEGLVSYLLAHAPQDGYLVAVPSAQVGASLVIETGQPVLYLGGFAGADPVIDAAGLEKLVQEGRLRYVLMEGMGLRGGVGGTGGAGRTGGEISVNQWVFQNCQAVSQAVSKDGAMQGRMSNLYQCGGG
jgi:hypothetical protein